MLSTSAQQLKEVGVSMGLESADLLNFIRKQQKLEREKRDEEKNRQRDEREKEEERRRTSRERKRKERS